jgi:hypothetical protein
MALSASERGREKYRVLSLQGLAMAVFYGSNDCQCWVILKPLNDPEKSLMNQQLRVILTRSRSNCHVLGERPPRNDVVAVGVLLFWAVLLYTYIYSLTSNNTMTI